MLEKEYQDAVNNIRKLGITVADDYKVENIIYAPKRASIYTLGVVYYSRKTIYLRTEGMSYVDILGTLYHEIIHTNPLCHNHGKYFKKYSDCVNCYMQQTYPEFRCGYKQKTSETSEYMKIVSEQAPYLLYDLKLKKVTCRYQKRSPRWSEVRKACMTNSKTDFWYTGGDRTSIIALEKTYNGYKYFSRSIMDFRTVLTIQEI